MIMKEHPFQGASSSKDGVVKHSREHIQADLLLLLVACVWGFGFVAQRAGMEYLGPYTFNGIRFLLGAVCLFPLTLLKKNSHEEGRGQGMKLIPPLQAGLLAGMFLFAGATLQQLGLQYTTAGKAGFITGLYVVLVPVIGLFFGQRTHLGTWLGGFLAVTGLYFLSIEGDWGISYGDLLEVAGAFFWACHVLLLSYLSPRTNSLKLAMFQFFLCGAMSLVVGFVLENIHVVHIIQAWVPLFYGGVISVATGYTLQVVVQKKAHPAHAAILLSLESAFAALGGWLLLAETLSLRAFLGCVLMLMGMIASQLWPSENKDIERSS
jgi:drug/metabolite transporter (DMT)-like permease